MLNWSTFDSLPGSPQDNFELLCRSLIRLRYGRHGQLAGLAKQPGVEFHLRIHSDCDLGPPGRWFGWQCRWYDLPPGRPLGNARRNKIEDALKKTKKALPELTDWILCTRHALTKTDQKWFLGLERNLPSEMRLALWNSADLEGLLTGDAEILRKTYFGDLVILPNTLSDLHQLSVAPIRKRWFPQVHQPVEAERTLRRMLGEPGSWEELVNIASRIRNCIGIIRKDRAPGHAPIAAQTTHFVEAAVATADSAEQIHRLLATGNFALLSTRLDAEPRHIGRDAAIVPLKLRSARMVSALYATNALADMRLYIRLLGDLDTSLITTLVAIIADAGGGKTHLAAQLTAPRDDRPAGILLHGKELYSGRTFDDLARSITIQGSQVPSMEALLAAFDAAGERAHRRLPLVFDGLNESENPMDWKAPLASLRELLRRFPHVLVICTVRTGARRPTERLWALPPEDTPARADFAKQALPDDVPQIEIPDFADDTTQAIQKYFNYFRINPTDAPLPIRLLSHPLTLRLFCQVTNPERKRQVGIEGMPRSLTALFERYLTLTTQRIAELAPRTHRYYEHDVRTVLDHIGMDLWDKKTRELPENDLRTAIGDAPRPWNESMVHMLEQEGVILLMPGQTAGQRTVVPVYDLLGGYLIANAILTKHGHSSFEKWLKAPATMIALTGDVAECHPLSADIFRALNGLVPRRLHRQQLWQMLDGTLRTAALRLCPLLEATYIDAATVAAISEDIRLSGSSRMFNQLRGTRSAPGHPLNADFLDSVLRSLPVADRDVFWTEWLRSDYREPWSRPLDIEGDVAQLEDRWKNNLKSRSESDRLRAKWLMWVLTTTVQNLRDRATRALYWFGRGDTVSLFRLAEEAADINDPYVFERTLAASYGVAMAIHADPSLFPTQQAALSAHAQDLFKLIFSPGAPARSTHVLIREYARRLIELAAFYDGNILPPHELARIRPPYCEDSRIAWPEADASEDETRDTLSPFRMDFENYTLGELVPGRRNYDFDHPGYRKIRAQILWRINQFGWTPERFGNIDRTIESLREGRFQDKYSHIVRYGKKYSIIAYFELRGWLEDKGLLQRDEDHERTTQVDIDPSFPAPTPELNLISVDLLGSPSATLKEWIYKGFTPDLSTYFHQPDILGEPGPWIMLDGVLTQENESLGRRIFAFIRSFLIAKSEANALAECLRNQPLGGRWLPEVPRTLYTFAGEMPWCSTYPGSASIRLIFQVNPRKVKIRRKRSFYFLDGKQVDLPPFPAIGPKPKGGIASPSLTSQELARVVRRDRVVEVEETQMDRREFRAVIPVLELTWAGPTIDGVRSHGIGLAKQLAQGAGLVHLPQTHDLQTPNQARATYGIAFRPHDFHASQRFFFLRKDTLQTLLQKNG